MLAFAPAGITSWSKATHPEVKALWVADTYAMLIESGSLNIDWMEMYGDSMLSADRKTSVRVLRLADAAHHRHSPGDELLIVDSSSATIGAMQRIGATAMSAHAGQQDPKLPATVKVTFKNGNIGSSGRRIDYGSAQYEAKTRPRCRRFQLQETSSLSQFLRTHHGHSAAGAQIGRQPIGEPRHRNDRSGLFRRRPCSDGAATSACALGAAQRHFQRGSPVIAWVENRKPQTGASTGNCTCNLWNMPS